MYAHLSVFLFSLVLFTDHDVLPICFMWNLILTLSMCYFLFNLEWKYLRTHIAVQNWKNCQKNKYWRTKYIFLKFTLSLRLRIILYESSLCKHILNLQQSSMYERTKIWNFCNCGYVNPAKLCKGCCMQNWKFYWHRYNTIVFNFL